MKNGLKDIVGKTVSGVAVAANSHSHPHQQVFLIFPDGTYFEFYGEQFSCASGLDKGDMEKACSYAKKGGGDIKAVYPADAGS